MPLSTPNDHWIIETLRNAPIPEPGPDVLLNPKPRPRPVWRAPAFATALGLALASLLLLKPTPTLAQISANQDKASQFTITNIRHLNGGATFKLIYMRSGELFATRMVDIRGRATTTFYSDAKNSIRILRIANGSTLVLKDDPIALEGKLFSVDNLLRPGIEPKRTHQSDWNGHDVEIYTLHDTYLAGRQQTFDQEVVVDRATELPIRDTVWRDNHQWGDEWQYEYGPAQPQMPIPPANAKTIDLRDERRRVEQALSKGPILLTESVSNSVAYVDLKSRTNRPRPKGLFPSAIKTNLDYMVWDCYTKPKPKIQQLEVPSIRLVLNPPSSRF